MGKRAIRRGLLALLALTLCAGAAACAAGSGKGGGAETPVTTGFECDADLTYRDMQVKGHLTRLTTGTLTLDIDEPETLKGMTMQWDGETVSVKMYGLSFGLDPAAVPETALGRSLLAALDAALHPSGEGKVTENGLVTNGEAAGGTFTITSDPETGSLLSLELPSAQLKATFTNFALKTA